MQEYATWFDAGAMTSLVEKAVRALGCGIAICDLSGLRLLAAGTCDGTAERYPARVNGTQVAWIEICHGAEAPQPRQLELVLAAIETAAEARNTVADLARATAQQWRELTLLYRSSQLLSGGISAQELADRLVRQGLRALRSTTGTARLEHPAGSGHVRSGEGTEDLGELLDWAASLERGGVVSEPDELRRLGYSGRIPTARVIALPVASQQGRYGAFVVAEPPGRSFGSEELKLADLLVSGVAQACENLELLQRVRESERLKRELELAAQIQASILPRPPMGGPWLEVAGSCTPAQVIGGDAFFVIRPPGDEWALVGVADVCGHGLSSALLCDAYASYVRALAHLVSDPAELLRRSNELLVQRLGMTGLFVTSLLVRQRPNGELDVASAGHPSPVLVEPTGAVRTVDAAGLPLGVVPAAEFRGERVRVAPGTVVVMFSDGVTETRSPDGEFFGSDRLREIVSSSVAAAGSCDDVHRQVVTALEAFRGGLAPEDDVTLVVARGMT